MKTSLEQVILILCGGKLIRSPCQLNSNPCPMITKIALKIVSSYGAMNILTKITELDITHLIFMDKAVSITR